MDGEGARRASAAVHKGLGALEGLTPLCTALPAAEAGLLREWLEQLAAWAERVLGGGNGEGEACAAQRIYRRLQSLWVERAVVRGLGSAELEEVLLDRLLDDGHLLVRAGERRSLAELPAALVLLARADLGHLQVLSRLFAHPALAAFCPGREGEGEIRRGPPAQGGVPPWDLGAEEEALKERFRRADDWGACAGDLADFVFRRGRGSMRGCPAYRLERRDGELQLVPLEAFAAFDLDWLRGNEGRVAVVEENTRHLLAGFPAHNVLIWGPRGCGKSSLLRGLITRYYGEGLRGIEIAPEFYGHLPELFALVRGRRERFLAVLDNISLEPEDPSLHLLSRVLDGGLEQVPDNLVFYGTSNFKDLVDRQGERPQGAPPMQMDEGGPNLVNQGLRPDFYDPQQGQRLDEQRALDDRFALKVFMDMPRKSEYEQLVLDYARRAGIEVAEEELLAAFNVWRMRHNHDLVGGRTARDFVIACYPDYARRTSRG